METSPLRHRRLPDLDALYIGGGFPETHAEALAQNVRFREDLKHLAGLKSLQKLDLSNTVITDHGLQHLLDLSG